MRYKFAIVSLYLTIKPNSDVLRNGISHNSILMTHDCVLLTRNSEKVIIARYTAKSEKKLRIVTVSQNCKFIINIAWKNKSELWEKVASTFLNVLFSGGNRLPFCLESLNVTFFKKQYNSFFSRNVWKQHKSKD